MNEKEESAAEEDIDDFDLYEEQRRIVEACPIQNVNGIVAGAAGAGKTTLINAVFDFKPEDAATTRYGKPTTDGVHKYTREGSHFTLYDTRGLETDNYDRSFEEIMNAIMDINKSTEVEEQIHFMWYCSSSERKRFEDGEVRFINEARSRSIIVIIVITQCYSETNDYEDAVKNLVPGIPVVPVLCKQAKINAGGKSCVIKSFGTDELLKATFSIAPQALAIAMTRVSQASLRERYNEAEDIISLAVNEAGTECHKELPFASIDKELGRICLKLMLEITHNFDLTHKEDFFQSIVNSIASTATETFSGKLIASSLLKIMAFFGSGIVGYFAIRPFTQRIEHSVGMRVVIAIGYAYLNAIFDVCSESNSNRNSPIVAETIAAVFKDNIKFVCENGFETPKPRKWD